MSTDKYTPSEEWAYIRNAYARSQKNETFGSEEETEDARGEALREFDDTLAAHDARVRRDAAREALDGYKAWRGTRQCPAISPPDPCYRPEGHTEPHAYTIPEGECDWREVDWSDTDTYRDTHYPEEAP